MIRYRCLIAHDSAIIFTYTFLYLAAAARCNARRDFALIYSSIGGKKRDNQDKRIRLHNNHIFGIRPRRDCALENVQRTARTIISLCTRAFNISKSKIYFCFCYSINRVLHRNNKSLNHTLSVDAVIILRRENKN